MRGEDKAESQSMDSIVVITRSRDLTKKSARWPFKGKSLPVSCLLFSKPWPLKVTYLNRQLEDTVM